KVRAGSGNLLREPAMSRDEARAAMAVGERLARAAADAGCELLLAGEMGIGNTTPAAALACALGAGLDDATVAHKARVVTAALARHAPAKEDALGALAAVGGLEIAAMAGLMRAGAGRRVP